MSKKKVVDTLFTRNRVHQLVLLVIPFLLYAQTFAFDFSFHDDDMIVLNNAQVFREFDLKRLFLTDAWMLNQKIELYRPWQSFTYAIDHRLGGNDASAYHVHNVLIFCVGIQLLYLFLLSIGLGGLTAFALGLVYAVHFLFAHTVGWIPARGDLYLFAFSMGSLILFYASIRKNNLLYAVLSAVCYFGALLSKESAIVLLPLMYLIGYTIWKVDLKNIRSCAMLGVSVVFTAFYLWMREQSVIDTPNMFTLEGFVYNLPVIPEEVFKFFVPVFFSVMPGFHPAVTWVGTGLVVAIIGLTVVFRRNVNMQLMMVGAAFFLLPILPSILYKPLFTGYAYDYLDHRMFFPGVGLLLIAFALLKPWLDRKNLSSNYLYSLVGVMAVIAFVNVKAYKNYTSYYDNATRTNPKSGLAWMNYGTMLARENNYPKMFEKFNTALEVIPNNIELRMKLADSYYTVKDFPRMMEQCKAIMQIDSTFAKAYFNIALFQSDQLKQSDSAIHTMNKAVRKSPKNPDAFYYRGLLYKQLGRNDSALVDFQRVTHLNPQHTNALFEQGHIYGSTARYRDAVQAFNNFLAINPNDGRAYFYRGQSLCLLNNTAEGCRDLQTALSLGVPDAQAKIDFYCR